MSRVPLARWAKDQFDTLVTMDLDHDVPVELVTYDDEWLRQRAESAPGAVRLRVLEQRDRHLHLVGG